MGGLVKWIKNLELWVGELWVFECDYDGNLVFSVFSIWVFVA